MAIPIHFPKLSQYDRPAEPVTAAIPFPEGTLADGMDVCAHNGNLPVPTQSRTTATWPDGSVKWLLVDFLVDLPGNTSADFTLHVDAACAEPSQPVHARQVEGRMVIDTGPLTLCLRHSGEKGLFHSALLNTSEIVAAGELTGPVLNIKGTEYIPRLDPGGWRIQERGPVRLVARAEGTHTASDGSACMDFTAAVTAYAGKPWVEVEYRIINREEPDELTVDSCVLSYRPGDPADGTTAVGRSLYRSNISSSDTGETLEHIIDAEQLVYEPNEHIPEVMYGAYWADHTCDRGGVCVSVFQAPQNFPKSFRSAVEGLDIGLIPAETPGITFIRGVARAQRMQLHFHGPDEDLEALNVRSLQYQMPDHPQVGRETYRAAGVTEDVFVDERVPEVERYLVTLADRRTRGYGMLNWGDTPEKGYTEQGRGRGEYVWTNNEYDFPHSMLLFYERIGERRLLDYLRRAAEHWMDVDVCHYSPDPLRHGGQITHSARHVTGGVTVSHEWVEGLLDYYHLTGDAFALQTALGIGENILRHLETISMEQGGMFSARETGWALRSLVALFQETHEKKWLDPADEIVGHFDRWMQQYGTWLAPYTSHTLVRVPFMIAVAINSLMRYWHVRPEDRVKEMIVTAAEDLVENALMYDGLFYYKELPSLHRRTANTLCLEALANARELSGDDSFIEAGMAMFRETIREVPEGYSGPKFEAGDAVIWPRGPGSKAFGANFLPTLRFYKAAVEAGVMDEDA
ncbi:MAG: glycoside hydrolase family 127 protein [Armatimonadota bacterium]